MHEIPFRLLGDHGFLALAFGFVYWLYKGDQGTSEVAYQIHFTGDVTGLVAGTAVRYRGIPVGRITTLRFDKDNPEIIIATIAIDPTTPVRTDTVAVVQQRDPSAGRRGTAPFSLALGHNDLCTKKTGRP